jgi:hypothetical protein
MQHTYKGSCHCGRVTFGLRGELRNVTACNCSLCARKGALWQGTDDAHFELLTGEDDLVLYQFGTMTAKHYACRHCGISTFSRPRIAPTAWVVNVRCLDGVDIAALEIHTFDGQNWEESAQRFVESRAGGAP